jgi:hypothetical protein
MSENFVTLCARGDVIVDDIDDYVEAWHRGEGQGDLHDFLGMTWEEYALWLTQPESLPLIVTAHIEGRSVFQIVEELESLPMAARAANVTEAKRLMRWLEERNPRT